MTSPLRIWPDRNIVAAALHEWNRRERTLRPDLVRFGVFGSFATDIGVYVTVDGGASWSVLGGNLPSTYVHDIVIHPRDRMIVAATHGRGLWVMDAVPVQVARR